MKSFLAAFAAASCGVSLLAPLPVWAQSDGTKFDVNTSLIPPLRGTLNGGGKGFLVEPPQLITETGVREVMAYPDGSKAIVLRVYYRPSPDFLLSEKNASPYKAQDVPGEASITVWNAFTRKANVVWRQRIEPGDLLTFQTWGILHGVTTADRVLVGVSLERAQTDSNKSTPMTILLVDTDKNVVRQVALPTDIFGFASSSNYVIPEPSPRLPFASLLGPYNATDNRIYFLRADGSLTSPITLPGAVSWRGWKNDGTVLRGVQRITSPTDPKEVSYQWYDADPRTGTLSPIAAPPKTRPQYAQPAAPETIPQLSLTTRPPLPQSGTKDASTWLQAKSDGTAEATKKATADAVLLCAEGEPIFLLPRAALFLSNGALYAAPIQTVSETTLTQIQKKQSRDANIRTVKQVGLALLGYIQDNDEKFPASASGLSDVIGPYLKDPHLLDGFVYTPPIPLAQAGMDNVSQVILGYLPGDGGKTVLYADGHVRWQDNP